MPAVPQAQKSQSLLYPTDERLQKDHKIDIFGA